MKSTAPPRLDHVGIAVADANRTARILEKVLGAPVYKVEDVEAEGVRTHFISAGRTKLELIEATSPESPIRRYLDKNREGLHHLAFEVHDIDAAWSRAAGAGLEPLGDGPKAGADGKRIFFLHPRQTGGILIEFCAQQPVSLTPAFIEIDGMPIATYPAGALTAVPVIVLHERGSAMADLAPLVHLLVQHVRVIGLDYPGHGQSAGAAKDLTIDALVRHVEGVIDAYALDRASLIGMGLGGYVAVHTAARFPERICAVVAHAPASSVAPAPADASEGWPPSTELRARLLISSLDRDPAFDRRTVLGMLTRYPEARHCVVPADTFDAEVLGETYLRFLL